MSRVSATAKCGDDDFANWWWGKIREGCCGECAVDIVCMRHVDAVAARITRRDTNPIPVMATGTSRYVLGPMSCVAALHMSRFALLIQLGIFPVGTLVVVDMVGGSLRRKLRHSCDPFT